MKSRILNALLIITSLMGYLEWGRDNRTFLFQAEAEVLVKLFTEPAEMLHPFIVMPLIGQLLLVITLFQKQPGKTLTLFALGSLSLLLVFMFMIGVLSMNYKIIISTIPFLIVGVLTVRYYRN